MFGDAQRLTQLLRVLLDNAVRYSHPGGEVRWQIHRDGDTVQFEVIDDGIGISPHELTQVFERHFRGSAARRHRASGSGLGLPIAQALAQAHGGSLALESPLHPGNNAQDAGTRAVLRLPLWAESEGSPVNARRPVVSERA